MLRVIVIGGGPAGSLSALLLARGGASVELLEQARFPRDKVCGECLSALGIDVLTRSGLADRLRAIGPVVLTRALVHPLDGPTLDLPLPRPMWGLTRYEMDRALLAAAADAGVVVRQPARCEGVTPGSNPSVRWRDLLTNRLTATTADWVVVADGKGTFPLSAPPATGDLGIKTHFENVHGPADAIELFAGDGHYGGLAAVNGNLWNAAFSIPASTLKRFRGDVDAAFAHAVRLSPALQIRLRHATRTRPWLAAPLPRFAVVPHGWIGVMPVGNAAAALEPIGGEGMGLAMRSAELAANTLLRSPVDASDLRTAYQGLWSLRRVACRSAARVVSAPDVFSSVAALAGGDRRITDGVMRWIGKGKQPTAAATGQ